MSVSRTRRLAAATFSLLGLLAVASSAAPQGTSACMPEVQLTGTPCIGNTVTLTMAGHADCKGCLVGSIEPGPTTVGNLVIPVDVPATQFIVGLGGDSLTFKIPNDPILENATYYLASVMSDGTVFEVSPGFQVTICPAGGGGS